MGAVKTHIGSLTLIAVIACLAGACGGGDNTSSSASDTATAAPTSTAQPSAFNQALLGVKDDGTWSKDTALAVFAAAFGPVPGVDTPQPDTSWHSGTLALRMVQAHWDELTDAQRQAVKDYVGASASSIIPAVYHSSFSLLDGYQQMLDQAAADISSHFGQALGIPIRVVLGQTEDPGAAWAWAGGNWNEVPSGSRATACTVTIPPSTASDPSRMPYLRWLFLHEVWHCFEYAMVDFNANAQNPPWVTEGEASWVAEAETGGVGHPLPENEHWGHYINDPGKPLFARSYDAVGFYGQLAHDNIDPWTVLKSMETAGSSDSAFQASRHRRRHLRRPLGLQLVRRLEAFQRLGDDRRLRHSTRRRSRHTAGNRDHRRQRRYDPGGAANSGAITNVHSTAFVTRFEVSGAGRVADANNGGFDKIVRADKLDLCTSPRGDCTCPPHSPNSDPPPETAPSSLRAAVTGEQHNNSQMNVRGISKEDWCGRMPTPTASPTATPASSGGTDCGTFLPESNVQAAVGVDIGQPTSLGDLTALSFACAWADAGWSLQGEAKSRPFPPFLAQLAGIPCAKSAQFDSNTIYCLTASQQNGVSAAGGFVTTSRWAFILTTATISIEDVAHKIVPILAGTGN